MHEFILHYNVELLKTGDFNVWNLETDKSTRYAGNIFKQTCSCKDSFYREGHCKHLLALIRMLVEGLL